MLAGFGVRLGGRLLGVLMCEKDTGVWKHDTHYLVQAKGDLWAGSAVGGARLG